MVKPPQSVIVVGGSFAGLQVASDLASSPHLFAVTVIDALDAWEFTPSIHEALGSGRDPSELLTQLDTKAFTSSKQHKHVRGRAVRLDESRRVVIVDVGGGEEVEVGYDVLVVATGCAYGSPVRGKQQTDRAGRIAEVRAWSKRLRDPSQPVLVVGGGAVGVELAAELSSSTKVTLATSAPDLVSDLPVTARNKARDVLRKQGVEVLFDTRATSVDTPDEYGGGTYELAGKKKHFGSAIFCFGGRPNTAWLGSIVDERGFVPRDAHMAVKPDVYVVGDAAAKPDAQRLASFAHFEGEYAASVIRAAASNATFPAPYTPPPRMVALSLGPRDGCFVYDSIDMPLPGFLVPYLKRAIEAWFIRLLPMPYAILKLLPGDTASRSWTKQPRKAAAH